MFARGERAGGQREIAIRESCIAETVAEGIERLALEIAIRAAIHGVVFEVGQLAHVFVERDGETAGGVVFAGEGVSYGRAALFAGIPRIEDRVNMLAGPVHCERAPVGENQHDGLAGSHKRFE